MRRLLLLGAVSFAGAAGFTLPVAHADDAVACIEVHADLNGTPVDLVQCVPPGDAPAPPELPPAPPVPEVPQLPV